MERGTEAARRQRWLGMEDEPAEHGGGATPVIV
jgi:hypothetical protein